MSKDSLTITDNRTGKTYEVPITYGTYERDGASIRSADLRQIKVQDEDFGLMGYDPAYLNTASCKSSVTYIDGDKGILRYRGYPIEQLAEKSTYLETAYLLLNGELPSSNELEGWEQTIASHGMIHESIRNFLDGFRWGSHTMGMLVSVLGAKSTFYPDARNMSSQELMELHISRLVSKVATVAAFCYRHSRGLPYIYPDASLGFAENFLNMLFNTPNTKYEPNPALVKALEVLFILHADHEQNCSASTMRGIGSSLADPYSATAGAAGALYGPLHGGANEAVLVMLQEIGDVKNVPEYIERVKRREVLLQGFGHRVYKNYDPRASIIKETADEVFEVTGRNPLIDIAKELERIALEDDFFVSRKLYPNVDFYSGIIYQAMGLPVDMYPVLFAIPRTAGWLAQWKEMMNDDEQKIARPRQVYTGYDTRDYVTMGDR
ncbi:TPA: citrate (Si)-synthase [Candidatus Latescibacteria bacterium]|nr:citrate (Si)-synthase [Gemmatimonadota bacterium]HAA76055.1 citrate (Si)-synthase [Candidatus Latescibacterota bacterium]|tara:strand:- start:72 stop:1379 length:1308 start_codon:yes stop_codon:yes gene_type:complete